MRYAGTLAALGLLLAVTGTAEAVTIQMYASPAPNGYGSPNWDAYVSNLTTSLKDGSTSAGNPATDPDAFYTIGAFLPTDVAVTGFHSWKSIAHAGSPFDQEYGQRLHFPWVVQSETVLNDIKLSNVGNMDIYWKDPDETWGTTNPNDPTEFAAYGDAASYRLPNYSSSRIGIKANGTIVDSGSADQMVNKIVYAGYGMAWAVYHDDTGAETDQERLDMLLDDLGDGSLKYLRATVTYYDDCNNVLADEQLKVLPVPEPVTMAGLILGIGALGGYIRRRR